MMPSLYIGIAGMTLILITFILDLFKKMQQDDNWYIVLNILGSGLLIYYSWSLNSIPFLILNAVWCVASIYDLIRVNVIEKNK